MANTSDTYDIVNGHHGGGAGGWGLGGGLGGIVLLLLFLGFLFNGKHEKDRHERQWHPDESNYEQSEKDIRDRWAHDAKAREDTAKIIEKNHAEHDKTRDQNAAFEMQRLRDENAAKDREIQTMRNEMYTDRRFNQVLGAVDGLGHQFNAFACRQPQAPPVFYATRSQCTAPAPRCDVRRGGCDFDGDFA